MLQQTNELEKCVIKFAKRILDNYKITAICHCRKQQKPLRLGLIAHFLLVVENFQPRLMNYPMPSGHRNISVLAVDKWVFERDVDRGLLGEALADALITPYCPVINARYLHEQEVLLKKRLVLELLQNLVTDFPEFSYEFSIDPEYFMYETLLVRARLFPPMLYWLQSTTKDIETLQQSLQGFKEALEELKNEGVVEFSGKRVEISDKFIVEARKRKIFFSNLFKTGQRALFTSVLGMLPQVISLFSQERDSLPNLQRIFALSGKTEPQIRDPEAHVYIKTASGLISLANRMDIVAFSRKILSLDANAEVKIESIGGILNDVYLVRAEAKGVTKKAVVKRFRDWSNFKWFPLSLWSVGTKAFTVLGKSRLERECSINRFLHSNGIVVPKVLCVSPNERLIFTEYVSGENLSAIIKRMGKTKSEPELKRDLGLLVKAGRLLARIHALDVVLGDAKPDNILVSEKSELYLTDLEQGSRNGDKSWDIAEFLYYAGHDISPFAPTTRIELMAKSFLNGYLQEGGEINAVRNAGNAKYTKVFSVFTFPHVMLLLSNICRKTSLPEKSQTAGGNIS
jgi:tRNA A-37 threonylcarbamoyl transferase component Bud32